jgi:hypothetical protein
MHIIFFMKAGKILVNKIKVREYQRGNQKWTFQRNWKHRTHKAMKNNTNTQYNMCWTTRNQTQIM